MENQKITVKCSTSDESKKVVEYARKGTKLSIYDPPSESKYIVLFHTDESYLGTHSPNDTWARNNGHTIIPYSEFKRDYLKELIIGEYYSYDGWIFIHVDPIHYSCNNTCIHTGTERFWYKNAAICGVNKDPEARNATLEEKQWLDACIQAGKFVSKEEALKSKTMNFEKGKWYKYSGWYIKFLEYDVHGIWRSSESIDADKRYSNSSMMFGGNGEDSNRVLLTDLSEIQKWLPEGHPDKVAEIPTKYSDYYKCIKIYLGNGEKVGVIYKHMGNQVFGKDDIKHIFSCSHSPKDILQWLVPSTEEEYKAQFNKEIITEPKNMKKVQHLTYPDVIHITSREQWEKLKEALSYNKLINEYKTEGYYLIGGGFSAVKTSYPAEGGCANYNVFEFSDITFSAHSPVEGECITVEEGNYRMIGRVITVNEGNSDGNYRGKADYIVPSMGSLHLATSWCYIGAKRDFRESTKEEIEWFKACIDAKKYIPQVDVPKPKISMKFKIGDVIKFKNNGVYIPEYEHSTIPSGFIIHGSTVFRENRGKIEHIHNKYYIVSYVDNQGKTVQLGFQENVLEPYDEASVLKVGMYLKSLVDYPAGGKVRKGEYGKIVDVKSKGGYADFPSQSWYSFTYTTNKYELMPEGWSPGSGDNFDYFGVFVKSGSGASPKDIGKRIKVLKRKPEGVEIANAYYHDGIYIETLPDIMYDTSFLMQCKFGNCAKEMVEREKPLVTDVIKSGDWVKCIGESSECSKGKSAGWQKDLVFKAGVTDGNIIWGGKCGNGVYNIPGHIRKAFTNEIPGDVVPRTAKIGEWIIVIDPSGTPGCKLEKGKVYEVNQVVGDKYVRTLPLLNHGGDIYHKYYRIATPDDISKAIASPVSDDWCIQMTEDITDDLTKYLNTFREGYYDGKDFGSYYGVKGVRGWCRTTPWGKILTKAEMYAKIGKVPSVVVYSAPGLGYRTKSLKSLHIPKRGNKIDTSVRKVRSLKGEVKQPKKVVLF